MRLPFLSHILDAVTALVRPRGITVLGSASLLPSFPALGESGQPLEVTLDADLLLDPVDEPTAMILKEAIGSESAFEQRYGYYADILRPAVLETLPAGWESRLHPVPGHASAFALDPYDLALVKLSAGRQKDVELLRALLRLGCLEPERLRQHYHQTPMSEADATTVGRNLDAVLRSRSSQ